LETIIKTNIKTANMYIDGQLKVNDIYIEGGVIKKIREDIRQNMFSGVYELDAEGLYAVPTFVDSGCFCLGSKIDGKELPIIVSQDYVRFGFNSFVTSINIMDKKERLINQKRQAVEYKREGMDVKYLSGGLKDRAYHVTKDIYTDIISAKNCVGAAVAHNDSYGSIDENRISRLSTQVEAAAYDKKSTGVVYLYLGDLSLDFSDLSRFILNKQGREKTVIPWFCNRGVKLLDSSIDYLDKGGKINLVAGAKQEDMSEDFVSLWDSLVAIYKRRSSLDGVLVSSFHGGYLPKKDDKTVDQRGAVSNIYFGVKKAVEMGLPIYEAIKVLAFNGIDTFDIENKGMNENETANFLIVDDKLNLRYIVKGEELIKPKSFRDLVLFI